MYPVSSTINITVLYILIIRFCYEKNGYNTEW